MPVELKDVRAVAELARLSLTAEEETRLVSQLNEILGFMETLNELDTRGVEPTSHPVPMENVTRKDQIEPFAARGDLMAAAPEVAGDYYRVPRIMD